MCEAADRPVGLTVTGVMSVYSSLAVLATWLITRRENLDWLTPHASSRGWLSDTRLQSGEQSGIMRAQCSGFCPSSRRNYWVTVSTIILHIWSRVQTQLIQSEWERGYRWEHNVITGRSSDKKADDLAQWAPHHLVIDFFEKIVKSWGTLLMENETQCLNRSCRWLLKGIQIIAWSPKSNDGPGGWNHVWSFDHVSNTVITPHITTLE